MKFVVIASKKDVAGMNIFSCLNPKIPRLIFDKEIVYAEDIDKQKEAKDADFIIFASKHQGKTPQMLSIHAPGNWKKADFGGKEGEVCTTSASVLKVFFSELNENIPSGWSVTMEATHHGPLISKPCLFIEVGSNENDWKNSSGAEAIAKTIENSIGLLEKGIPEFETAIAVGGPHYCPNFNKIQLNSKYAISHVIPEYCFPITSEILQEAVSKTVEKVTVAIIDWKGCGKSESRQSVVNILESTKLDVLRSERVDK